MVESLNRSDKSDATRRLDQFLGVAKGEINRLDYIITQFLQAIRPTLPPSGVMAMIRRAPEQYWWVHRRWKEPPPRRAKAMLSDRSKNRWAGRGSGTSGMPWSRSNWPIVERS